MNALVPFALLEIAFTWVVQFIFSFNSTLRYLALCTCSSVCPCKSYFGVMGFFLLVTDSTWHLETLNSICQVFSHVSSLFRSSWSSSSSLWFLTPWSIENRVVCEETDSGSDVVAKIVYIDQEEGMPDVTWPSEGDSPSTTTCWVLPARKC